MENNTASISVIIPVYNAYSFLREAIASVQRQTLAPLEIIVVDDGSTDNCTSIARESGSDIRCLQQSHAGPAAARNLGLQEAKGELIAFLDADDLWPEEKLAWQTRALAENLQAGIVLGSIQCLKQSMTGIETAFIPFGKTWIWCLLGAALIRKTVFAGSGFFNSSLRYGEDLDWFLRVEEQGIPVLRSEQTALFYRIHGNNMTRGIPHAGFNLPRILKDHLERRRTAEKSPSFARRG